MLMIGDMVVAVVVVVVVVVNSVVHVVDEWTRDRAVHAPVPVPISPSQRRSSSTSCEL